MSDIAFEILEGAIKEMERAHLGIDAIVHALVAQALHFARYRGMSSRGPTAWRKADIHRSCTTTRLRCSSLRLNWRLLESPALRTLNCRARHFTTSAAQFGLLCLEQAPVCGMPKSLSNQIRECHHLRAEECRCWAETASQPSIRNDYLAIERRWLSLARGYEFAEQLDSFTSPFTSEEPANEGTGQPIAASAHWRHASPDGWNPWTSTRT
jgi:hypothetical protein